jgi:hypothetical protein
MEKETAVITIGQSPDHSNPCHNAESVEMLAAWYAFKTGFRRSRKDNLWCQLQNGRTVTIFKRSGKYAWCIAGAADPRYSSGKYATEDEALVAAWRDVREGWWEANPGAAG